MTAVAGQALLLRYDPPYDWESVLAFLAARAIPGVERVEADAYLRTIAQDGVVGTVEITHARQAHHLVARLRVRGRPAPAMIAARLRRVFDTDADPAAIGEHLSHDPELATLVAQRPGLRVPGGWDGFELAIRAVLGQQVTLAAARKLAGTLVALCGTRMPPDEDGLSFAFPTPQQVCAADLASLGMPAARRATVRAVAAAACADPMLFAPTRSLPGALQRLRAIPGIGDWSAQYIALRALHDPDAFPATDLGLLRGAARLYGKRPSPSALLRRAEAWRPWRAYAAQHLWSADAAKGASP